LYGPSNAIDKSESTCWNSDGIADGDTNISFILAFHRLVIVKEIRAQFQGGFAAEECTLHVAKMSVSNPGEKVEWNELSGIFMEPEDSNEMQRFDLTEESDDNRICELLKISFQSSTDFYGRVTLYKLELWGDEIL